ncbi:MAG: aspartate aminotransferase family protein [Alistipes sp.]|jgi:acetylornithine/succinyldiaminopimelate/putrescine aminotransferase|nr:aspartate aminotransferase family protein [Alistipes sp.]
MRTLRQQFLEHVGQTSPSPLMIEVARAGGVYLWTPPCDGHPGGRRFFDLISGVSVSNVGHGRPEVVEAVRRQAAEYMHTMVYGEMVEAPQVRYAARLAELLPEELRSVYFVNSGAEAVEGALKLAKRATGRRGILAFRRAYHGSTHGALSVMSSPEGDEWRAPFEPLLPGVDWLAFNDFNDLERVTRQTACVLVEPVQGEAGVRLPAPGFLQELRRRCDETGTLLVFDEVQTGMGRSGALFAFMKYGVVPDIMCVAKAFGGGMPLGAFISSRETMSGLSHDPSLGHITTFGGHPVCCAAGLAALEVILKEDLSASAETKGALCEELLCGHPAVKEVRRAGLLMAVELGDSAKMFRVMELFRERGVLSDWFLFCDTAFRISPPLVVTPAEVRESCAIISGCLDDLL